MENPKQEDRPMELGATDMEIEQVDQDPSLTEDGSEETPIENANVQEITSGHDDIDAEVSKLIRYKKEESARLYQKYIMAGEEEKADLAFQKMRKYGAQLLILSGKLVSPAINPVKKEIGLRLTQNDIPKFQLTSWPDIPFPGEKCYESVEHFLRSFEKVIYSTALDIQEVWRRYLPVSLAFDHDDWIEKDLKRCDTWNTARIVFTNKFLTDNARTDAMHRLFTMTMNKNESVSSYMTRFLSTCIEAGANKNDPMVDARFKASFSEPVLEKCKTAFVLKENKNVPWTVERAAEIARNLLGDDPRTYTGASYVNVASGSKKIHTNAGPVSVQKRNKGHGSSGAFFCSKHGGANANHNEDDCFSKANKKNDAASTIKNKYYGNKNLPQKASTSKPCRYCGRSWSHGHQCQEYADYKRKLHVDPNRPRDSDKSIYAIVRTVNDEIENDHDMTEAENNSYDCKAL